MSLMSFVMMQLLSTVVFFMWYMKRHPSDAMAMLMKMRSMFMR